MPNSLLVIAPCRYVGTWCSTIPLSRRACPLRRLARSGGPGGVSPGQGRAARALPARSGRGDWPWRPGRQRGRQRQSPGPQSGGAINGRRKRPPTAPLRLGGSATPCVRGGGPGLSRLRRADADPSRDPSARGHPRHPGVSGPAVARTAHRPRPTRPRVPRASAFRLVGRRAGWSSHSPAAGTRLPRMPGKGRRASTRRLAPSRHPPPARQHSLNPPATRSPARFLHPMSNPGLTD